MLLDNTDLSYHAYFNVFEIVLHNQCVRRGSILMTERSSTNILVVDDEAEVRTLLRECFELEGYNVIEAANGGEMHTHLADSSIDLITLDLTLEGEDGLTLAREIRTQCDTPIIMVTGKGDMIDRVVGLEVGADDYITKPFHLREVLARVRSVLRRYKPAAPPAPQSAATPDHLVYSFSSWTLDITSRELVDASGVHCDLTTAEFNLLELFVKKAHRTLSRDAIMEELKGHDWSPLDRSIDTLVGRLRKKIEVDNTSPKLIKTIRGVGYMFTAEINPG